MVAQWVVANIAIDSHQIDCADRHEKESSGLIGFRVVENLIKF